MLKPLKTACATCEQHWYYKSSLHYYIVAH